MSAKTLIVSLKCENDVLSTVEFSAGGGDVLIGRSHACAMRTPSDDHSVSGTHARIFWKGSSAFIEDTGSRNGVYVNGKRIDKPVKLEVDGIYGIGSCRLVVSRKTRSHSSVDSRCHKLEYMNGDHAHEIVPIRPRGDSTGGAFTLGLDPGNDIVLTDMLVSRRHVAFTVKSDGSCWLKDLGSRNGTYVNGQKLTGKERYLNDGDKISIAYFDFRFLHKDVKHTRSFLWAKLGVLAVLGIILSAGFVFKEFILSPSSGDFRRKSADAAAKEDFSTAFMSVTNAFSARGGETDKMQNEVLLEQLNVWSKTRAGWFEFKRLAAAGEIKNGKAILDAIVAEPRNWTWNDTTAKKMHTEAEFADALFTVFYQTLGVLRGGADGTLALPIISERITKTESFLKNNASAIETADYLAPAVRHIRGFLADLKTTKNGIESINEAISTIKVNVFPDFTSAVKSLTAVAESKNLSDGVKAHARKLLPVCRKFMETAEFLKNELKGVTALDFDGVFAMRNNLPLPTKDECASHSVFSAARDAYVREHDANQSELNLLAPMIRNLEDAGLSSGQLRSLVESVTSMKTWNDALAFDCFAGRFPEPSRFEPNSVYDGLCGIEITYDNLRNLPKPPGRQTNVRMKFVPKTQKLKAVFNQNKTLISVLDRPDGRKFQSGRLGELYAEAVGIEAKRTALIDALRKKRDASAVKNAPMTRDRIVAGFFAEYFSESPSYADLRRLEVSFKALERKMTTLNEKYDMEPDPEKRIAIRKQILATGIPGGEAVRKRWVEVSE